MPPSRFVDGGLVGIDERLAWRIVPIVERAQALAGWEAWPEWRRDELIRALVRQHAIFTDGGMSFDDALAHLDGFLAAKSGENP